MKKIRYFIVATNESGLHLAATQKLDDIRGMVEISDKMIDQYHIGRAQELGGLFDQFVDLYEPDRDLERREGPYSSID